MSTLQEPAAESASEGNGSSERAEIDDAETEQVSLTLTAKHRSDHWRLVGSGAMLAAGIALVAREPALFLVTVVAVGLLAVRSVATPPEPEFAVDRSLSPANPEPGETVTVETTITNLGEARLPDCRFIDRVPDELCVTDGTPRMATALGPGEECTLTYDLAVSSGNHQFDGVYAIVSDWTATNEHEYELTAERALQCRYDPDPLQVPVLRTLTTPYAGRLATDDSGEGLEFYAVREYRTGDPLRRIDWNQYASTGELATLQFRTERSAAVVVVVDNRREAYTRADRADHHGAEQCVEAAGRLAVTLLDADHRIGIATLGPDFWLSPSDTSEHRRRLLDAFSTDSAFSARPPEQEFPIRLRALQLLHRLTETTQVVICTPLVDDRVEVPIQLFESAGHEVTVVSPDPTRMDSRGGIVATLERKQRINRIHGYGVPVVDWGQDTSFDVAVARRMKGWSE